MKIKLDEITQHNLLGNALLTLITDLGFKRIGIPDDQLHKIHELDGFDVVLTINGVEAPLKKFFERLEEDIKVSVKKTAFEMAMEKCSDLLTTVYDLEKVVKQKTKERLGIDWDDE